MITVFTCKVENCTNLDLAYRVEDAPEVVICGGCGITLEGNKADE